MNYTLTNWWMMLLIKIVPVFGRSGSIALPSIFEPIPNLCWRQTGRLSQFTFLCRIWIWILQVPFAQQTTCALFEAMRFLFAIPDGAGQRELFAHTILVNGTWNNRIGPIYNFNWLCVARNKFGYLKVGRAIFPLHDSGPPATLPAIFHASVWWICDVRVSCTIRWN